VNSTDIEIIDLTNMEFDPPCEYRAYIGLDCPNPAEWIIWTSPIGCGCDPAPEVRNFCTPCKETRLGTMFVKCPLCSISIPALSNILRIEPIRKGTP
jgi:hypothetical protein